MAQALLFDPSVHKDMAAQFADIQIACLKFDDMVGDYLPPFDHNKVEKWWTEKAAQAAATPTDRYIIYMEEDGRATGVVMLHKNSTETGGFRGEVQKLIVSPDHRQKKIARKLMAKVEDVARAQGISLLLLDTDKDSPANNVYPKWGYQQYGEIPRYEKRPNGGWMDGTFYYKDLSAPDALSLE